MAAMNRIVEFIRSNKPKLFLVLAVIAGFLFGLLYAYVLVPVEYIDTTPDILRRDLQVDYMRMAIDSYQVNRDINLAVRRWMNLGEAAPDIFMEIQNNRGKQSLDAIQTYGRDVQIALNQISPPAPQEEQPSAGTSNFGRYLLIGLAVLALLAFVAALVYFFMRLMRRSSSGVLTPAMQAQQLSRQTEQTDYGSLGLADPIAHMMTTYVLGDNLYNESFSITSPAGEFLGEYGVDVSEKIGVGEPKRVTAMEVWLFDKNDIKTATKVLMSANAYNDLALRQRLEAKGELVLVEPQKQIVLETETLQMLVTVVELEYGEGPLPPNSYFERITLELAVWPKQG